MTSLAELSMRLMRGLRRRCEFGLGLAVAVTALGAAGATLHVSPDGSDRNSGVEAAAPLRTVLEASRRARPGDVIELAEGTYAGAIISNPARADAWIRLTRRGQDKVIVQGAGTGPALYFYHRTCDEDRPAGTVCEPMYWEVDGLEVRGSPQGGGDGNAIKIDTPFVRIKNSDLCCARADIVKLVRTADDVEILANRIHHNAAKNGANAQGVDIVGADRVRVAFNHVFDIPDIGMYAKGNARSTVFEHNFLERIWSHGIMLGQSTDADRLVDGRYETYDGVIRDNVVLQAGWGCVATSSSFKPDIHHNTCIDVGLRTHGSVLISNESEVRQPGSQVSVHHNVFIGGAQLPAIKVTNDALVTASDLTIDHNLYARRDGGEVRLTWRDLGLEAVPLSRWRTASRQDQHSVTAMPQIELQNAPALPVLKIPSPVQTLLLKGDDAGVADACNRPRSVGARKPCSP